MGKGLRFSILSDFIILPVEETEKIALVIN